MPAWTRVRDRISGHEIDISPPVDLDLFELVNDDAYPDLDDITAVPRPPVHAEKSPAPAKAKTAVSTTKEV